MNRLLLSACLLAFTVAGCNSNGGQSAGSASAEDPNGTPASPAAAQALDPMASHDPGPGTSPDASQRDDQPRPEMQVQVVLDRLGFGPGVIDGKMGLSTHNALMGFQEANGLKPSGEIDDATKGLLARWSNIPATRVVTIPADFAAGPFAPLPKDPTEQAKLPAMGYASLEEKLAERFHTTADVLRALNPPPAAASPAPAGTSPPPAAVPSPSASPSPSPSASAPVNYAAGQQIRVPNVGADALEPSSVPDKAWLATLASLGVGTDQPSVARIEVSKRKGTLSGFDAAGKLVALFTVTTGSSHDPLPLGTWKINAIDQNPKFHYNPALFWDVSDSKPTALLPPGPNGPVGVVWIDLSKPHYGIHGTPEPQTIGRTESHGCVRLTNWDAARLALMVTTKTKVDFVA